MTDKEKLNLAIDYLEKIANFGHEPDCPCRFSPVYECGCYDKSQWELAEAALEKLS